MKTLDEELQMFRNLGLLGDQIQAAANDIEHAAESLQDFGCELTASAVRRKSGVVRAAANLLHAISIDNIELRERIAAQTKEGDA